MMTTMESNYALYRNQLKKMNKDADEGEIYAGWHELTFGKWNIQNKPIKGYDGLFHYLYISVRDDDKIYVGRRSSDTIEDGYVGSGLEVVKSVEDGHKFKTTILEFFRNANAAYDEEHKVVNGRFLTDSDGIVLNGTVEATWKPDGLIEEFTKKSNKKEPNICKPAVTIYKPVKMVESFVESKSAKTNLNRPKYFTFPMLGLKTGDVLNYLNDEKISCTVLDERNVSYNGKTYSLNKLAREVGTHNFHNALDMWKYKGNTLAKIRDEKYPG